MPKRIIAFLDILGFRERVEDKSKFDTFQKDILDVVSHFFLRERSNNETKKLLSKYGLDITHTLEITYFSDCIVLSCEDKHVSPLLQVINSLSGCFIVHELFLRGGIAYGKLFHNDRIVFGPAMNEAYELESKKAIYPRIIISEDAYGVMKKNCSPLSKDSSDLTGIKKINESLKPMNNVVIGKDKTIYLKPFPKKPLITSLLKKRGITSIKELRKIQKSIIEKNLTKFKDNKNCWDKYSWLAKKLNQLLQEERIDLITLPENPS